MPVTTPPNRSEIVARIVSAEPASDGWGAWANVAVEKAAPARGKNDWAAALVGTVLKVFVPPPLVASVLGHEHFEGGLSVRGGPAGVTYVLMEPNG